jgi:hypothetical protein
VTAQPDSSSLRSAWLRFLIPLAAFGAMAAFASLEVDPAGAAESGYLALLATAVLLSVAALAPAPAVELGLGATLATSVVWALPQGPGRGAALGLLLAATLAVAAGRALAGNRLGLSVTIPLSLGVQFLLRGELLFHPHPDLRTLVALLVLPLAGAAAVTVLSERHGMLPLLAAATAVAVAPGWDVAATLGIVTLAAGDVLGRREAGWQVRAAAVVPFLVALAWKPGPGLAAAVCGLALWRPRVALGLAVPVAAALHWLPWGEEGMREGFRQLAWLPLLLPAVALPARDRTWNVATAVLIAATVPLIPDRAVLAAPLGLAALALRPDGPAAVPQRVWTSAVLGGTALLASYPWLREEPLAEVLAFLGLPAGWMLATGIVGAYLILVGAGFGLRLPSLASAGLAGTVVLLVLAAGLPPAGTLLLPPEMPVVLDAGKPAWETVLDPEKVESVIVESSLGNGAGLPPGTPVAILQLQNPGGGSAWTLRAGDDTGEWAARRPDVAQTGGQAPSPWVSWVAGDFFAQRYRSRWALPRPERFARLRVERAPGLPPEVVLALHQLEVRE